MNTSIILNKKVARRVLEVVDAGLVDGLGTPEPGKMCVEAAVNYALGLPHGDNPSCVGKLVRDFKVSLNDSYWSSDKARTKGMRKLAIAQLGSDTLDQDVFLKTVGFKCMTTVLPVIVENAVKEDKDNAFVKKHADGKKLLELAKQLKKAKDFGTAKKLTQEIRDIYSAYANANAFAYAFAYAYASASASAYAFAYAFASAYASAKPIFTDKILNLTAKACLDTLIEMKSPGVKWLDICN